MILAPLLVAAAALGLGYWLITKDDQAAPSTGGVPQPQTAPSGPNTTDLEDGGYIVSPAWQNMITSDRNTWPSGDKVWDICRAIAVAEGYDTNGAAFNLNNPGDLGPGDEHGFAVAGVAEWHGGSNIIHFANAIDGWNACYAKVSNIVSGKSRVYGQNWTIAQIGQTWAAKGQPGINWANNVARELGGLDPNQDGFDDYVNS